MRHYNSTDKLVDTAEIPKAQESNMMYYFSNNGIVRLTLYSKSLEWGLFILILIVIALFTGRIGGIIYGVIAGVIASIILDSTLSSSRIKKWNKLSFKELNLQKGATQISWSKVSKALLKTSYALELYVDGKKHNLILQTDAAIIKKLLKTKLGKNLEVKQAKVS